MKLRPKVTIVITNFNGFTDLVDCLHSLQMVQYSHLEIIVCDNASTDGSPERIKRKFGDWVKMVVLQKNYGYPGGLNRVLKKIHCDYVFIINNDTYLTQNIVSTLVDYADRHSDVTVIQPKLLALKDRKSFDYAGALGGFLDTLGYPYCRGRVLFEVEEDRGQYDSVTEIFWASGTAMFCRYKLFKKIGFFDGDLFSYFEEVDFCWRALKAGFRIIALPQAVMYHKGLASWGKHLANKTYLNHRNNLLLLVKNLTLTRLIVVLPLRIILDYAAIVRYLLEGRLTFTLAVIAAHTRFITLFIKFWKKRTHEYEQREKYIEQSFMKPLSIVYEYYFLKRRHFSKLQRS